MADLNNIPAASRQPTVTQRGTSPSVPVAYADEVRETTTRATKNSVQDALDQARADVATASARIDHLQSIVNSIDTSGTPVWQPVSDLDYDAGWRVGSSLASAGLTFSDPRRPIAATRQVRTIVQLHVPRGIIVEDRVRFRLVRAGQTRDTHPRDTQYWRSIANTGGAYLSTWELWSGGDTDAQEPVGFEAGDTLVLEIAERDHEISIPLEALEQEGAHNSDVLAWDADLAKYAPRASEGSGLHPSSSIGYDSDHGYAYIRAGNPGSFWATPSPAPEDQHAVPMRLHELASDDVRTIPGGAYELDWSTGDDAGFTLVSRQDHDVTGFRPLDSQLNPGYEGTRPSLLYSGGSGAEFFYYNRVAFTAASAGSTFRDMAARVTVVLGHRDEWRAGDKLKIELLSLNTDRMDSVEGTYTWVDGTNFPHAIQTNFSWRLKNNDQARFRVRLTMTPGDGRATTSRTIYQVLMLYSLPHIGRYPLQGLDLHDDFPPASDYPKIGLNLEALGIEHPWLPSFAVGSHDDNRSTLDLALGRAPGGTHDVYVEAQVDMRQVHLRAYASTAPSYRGGTAYWVTWLPGVIVPHVIGALALSDEEWIDTGCQATALAVLRGQRFAFFVTDRRPSGGEHPNYVQSIGTPKVLVDTNVAGSDQPAYQPITLGLLRTHQVYSAESAARSGARTIQSSHLPLANPRQWTRLIIAFQDGGAAQHPTGEVPWWSGLLDGSRVAGDWSSGQWLSGMVTMSDGGIMAIRAGFNAAGSLVVHFDSNNRRCLGMWVEYVA